MYDLRQFFLILLCNVESIKIKDKNNKKIIDDYITIHQDQDYNDLLLKVIRTNAAIQMSYSDINKFKIDNKIFCRSNNIINLINYFQDIEDDIHDSNKFDLKTKVNLITMYLNMYLLIINIYSKEYLDTYKIDLNDYNILDHIELESKDKKLRR